MTPPIIRSGDTARQVEAALDEIRRELPALDSQKHRGTVKLREDPRTTQQRMRDEWDERPR